VSARRGGKKDYSKGKKKGAEINPVESKNNNGLRKEKREKNDLGDPWEE